MLNGALSGYTPDIELEIKTKTGSAYLTGSAYVFGLCIRLMYSVMYSAYVFGLFNWLNLISLPLPMPCRIVNRHHRTTAFKCMTAIDFSRALVTGFFSFRYHGLHRDRADVAQ